MALSCLFSTAASPNPKHSPSYKTSTCRLSSLKGASEEPQQSQQQTRSSLRCLSNKSCVTLSPTSCTSPNGLQEGSSQRLQSFESLSDDMDKLSDHFIPAAENRSLPTQRKRSLFRCLFSNVLPSKKSKPNEKKNSSHRKRRFRRVIRRKEGSKQNLNEDKENERELWKPVAMPPFPEASTSFSTTSTKNQKALAAQRYPEERATDYGILRKKRGRYMWHSFCQLSTITEEEGDECNGALLLHKSLQHMPSATEDELEDVLPSENLAQRPVRNHEPTPEDASCFTSVSQQDDTSHLDSASCCTEEKVSSEHGTSSTSEISSNEQFSSDDSSTLNCVSDIPAQLFTPDSDENEMASQNHCNIPENYGTEEQRIKSEGEAGCKDSEKCSNEEGIAYKKQLNCIVTPLVTYEMASLSTKKDIVNDRTELDKKVSFDQEAPETPNANDFKNATEKLDQESMGKGTIHYQDMLMYNLVWIKNAPK